MYTRVHSLLERSYSHCICFMNFLELYSGAGAKCSSKTSNRLIATGVVALQTIFVFEIIKWKVTRGIYILHLPNRVHFDLRYLNVSVKYYETVRFVAKFCSNEIVTEKWQSIYIFLFEIIIQILFHFCIKFDIRIVAEMVMVTMDVPRLWHTRQYVLHVNSPELTGQNFSEA